MRPSGENICLPPGSFYLLNDNDVPFSSRLKLCRALWVSTNYVFPHKHQSLLNWLCIQIGKLENQTDSTLAWRELATFLKSKSLTERILQQPSDILIKHILIQAVTESITKNYEEVEAFEDIVLISKCLIQNNRITSPLRLRFDVLAVFLADWINVVIRFEKKHANADELCADEGIVIEDVLQLVALLLNHCENMIKKQTNKRRIHSLVCQHLLVPTYKLHYICCQILTNSDKSQSWIEVADGLESFITLSMFSKNCLDIYTELIKESKASSVTDTDKEIVIEKKRKFSKIFEIFSISLHELFNQNGVEEIQTAHYARYFLHSFLSSYSKSESKLKFAMLKEIFKYQCKHKPRCSAHDVTCCAELNLFAVRGILELAMEFRLYQPAVDREHGSIVLNWFKEIASSLLKKYQLVSTWYSCIQALLNIDNKVMEPHMIDLIAEVCFCGKFAKENRQLIVCLIEVYAKIRQPVKLVKTLLQAIKKLAGKDLKSDEIVGVAYYLESFGELMGSELLCTLSPSLVIKMWTLVVEKVNEAISLVEGNGASETYRSSAIDHFHLLVCFFHCVVSHSPMLVMWNHLGVRGKMDACVGSLKKAACSATKIMDLQTDENFNSQTSLRLVESSLRICLSYQRVTSFIEHYCLKESENVSPGVVSLLYKGQQLHYKELLAQHYEPYLLACLKVKPTEDSSKLLVLQLLKMMMSNLCEKIDVVEMLQKTGEIEGLNEENEVCEIKMKCKVEMERLTEVLTDLLGTIDISESMGRDNNKVKGFLNQALKTLTATFPLLQTKESQQYSTFTNWIAEAIFAVISDENYPNFFNLQNSVSLLLHQLSTQHDIITISKLLHRISKEMSDTISDAVPLLTKLLNDNDVSDTISALFKDDKHPTELDARNLKAASQLTKLLNVFSCTVERLYLDGLSIQQTEVAVRINLYCIKTVDTLLSSNEIGDNVEKERLSSLLQRFVNSLIQLTKRRMNIDILKYLPAEIMIPYFARLLEILPNDSKENIRIFLRNLIQLQYGNSSCDGFVETLHKRYSTKKLQKYMTVGTLATMIHLHMDSILDLLCCSNDSQKYSHTEDKGKKRKLKIRSNTEICKKMKLAHTDDSQNDVPASLPLMHLQKLVEVSYEILGKLPAKTTTLKYGLLHSLIIAKDVLLFHDIKLKDFEDVHAGFRAARNLLKNERNNESMSGILRFTSSYLQYCENHVFDKGLLGELIQLLSCFDKNSAEKGFLHETIVQLLKRLPVGKLPTEIFEDILAGLREDKNYMEMLNWLEFIHLLLHSGILLGTDKDHQQLKSIRNRFVKCVLDEMLKHMHNRSREVNFNDAEIMQKILLCVHSILQVKWIRLQLTHVSFILCSINHIPLVDLANIVENEADAESFLAVYEACYKVVHFIIVSYEEIRSIVPLVIAAYRQLCKSALYLSRQRESTSNQFHTRVWKSQKRDEWVATKGIQCARMMEKLSQFIADNFKNSFSKCISYVVADYVHCVCLFTIVPAVKMSFTLPIYHLISIMDEYGIAMVRNALPAGFRDVFQTLHLDYCRNFKYMGQV